MLIFINSRKFYRELRNVLTTLYIVFFISNVQGQCPSTNIVEDPKEFVWDYHPATSNDSEYYSGVMEVGEANFTINGESLTTRAYRQEGNAYSIPGPTIKVIPGKKYILRFHNTLPYEPLNPNMNVFKDPNASNIHTHGLHISGESPSDDVTRVFEGGHGGDFVWDIPSDHMGGTYWYHAHHHGSTFLQVSGGMFGMLIVDDSADNIPANVAAMTERKIILGYLDPGAAGTGGDVLLKGTLPSTWTINGLVQGNICLPPNTWQHWRVLLADRSAMMKTIEFGPECEVMVLARDGVWRTVAPKDLASNKLDLTGASRADFAIRATGNSWLKVAGNIVANIYTSGTPDTSVHPFKADGVSTWSAKRPDYLRDLRNVSNVHNESVSMGARTINGSKFDHDVPNISLPANQVQEWSLSGAVQHPFHLHVYHVQALRDDSDFEAGEYYDVVSSRMSVRFDLNNSSSSVYDGRTIMHCHILSHEDQGAMGWLDVNGGAGPPTFPNEGNYSVYYSLAGGQQPPLAPTNLSATAASSASINLNWVDNAVNENGFDIERSTNGTNFSYLDSVDPDVVTYSDINLTPSTTYYYRILAYNTAGNSAPSNVANATTLSSGGGLVMHVQNITVVRKSLNGNRFQADATVTIYDSSGSAVSGATVDGNFTGPTSRSVSGTTDINGIVTLSSQGTKSPSGEWCLVVTNVTLAGATYDSAANVMTQACESVPLAKVKSQTSKSNLKANTVPSTYVTNLKVYPNPFKNSTQITFQLQEPLRVVLEVYNVLGKSVTVITDQNYESGQHYINWNAQKISSGMYFLILKSGEQVIKTQKLLLIN